MMRLSLCAGATVLALSSAVVAHETGASHEHASNPLPVLVAVLAMVAVIGWRLARRAQAKEKIRAED